MSSEATGALLSWGIKQLKGLGAQESRASSERLLAETLGIERSFLYLEAGQPVSSAQAGRYRNWIRRRAKRIPVAYLLKKAYFWDEVLEVSEACLIPRPETEILVENFIRHSGFSKESRFSFLDIGTGSGAIAIAILRHFPNARAVFSDISAKALAVAKRNARRYGLLKRAKFQKSDLFSAWNKKLVVFDAVISNPPYVADEDWKTLEPELMREPVAALRGGKGGFFFYREIGREAKKFLKPGGLLVFEMGAGQAGEIKKILRREAYAKPEIYRDYLKVDRVLMARVKAGHG